MADARLLHKRGSHGDRIVALSHLEHRVWVQYVLSADDYGVMRASASVLRADNPRLEREPMRVIEAAMKQIVASTLVSVFTHQSGTFWWQLDWQDFQQVRYPRDTSMPAPSPELLLTATLATQELFALRARPARQRFRKVSETSPEDSGKVSETSPEPARAGGRETLTPTLTPTLPGSGSLGKSAREPEILVTSDGIQPAWGNRRVGAMARTDGIVVAHPRCDPATFAACNRGMCVPAFLAAQWRAQLGTTPDDAYASIRGVVERALSRLPPGGIGDDPLKFWRAAWTAEHGSQAPVPMVTGTTKVGRTLLAAKAAMERAGGGS